MPPLSKPAHIFVLNTCPFVYLVELHLVTSMIGISACFKTSRQHVPIVEQASIVIGRARILLFNSIKIMFEKI